MKKIETASEHEIVIWNDILQRASEQLRIHMQSSPSIQSFSSMMQVINAEAERLRLPKSLRAKDYALGNMYRESIGDAQDRTLRRDMGLERGGIQDLIAEEMMAFSGKHLPHGGYFHPLGLPIVRTEMTKHIHALTGLQLPMEGVAITHGASQALDRYVSLVVAESETSPVLFTSVPGYTPVHTMAAQKHMQIIPVHADASLGYCPDPDALKQQMLQHPSGIISLTPATNPCATTYDADALRAVLQMAQEFPNISVLADITYFGLISEEVAHQLSEVIYRTGILGKTVFAVSGSKLYGAPDYRIGALASANTNILQTLEKMSNSPNPSDSIDHQARVYATLKCIDPSVFGRLRRVLIRRKQGVLKNLREMSRAHALFDISERDIAEAEMGVPLYAYLHASGDAAEILRYTGMGVIPGNIFGDPRNNMVRFAFGVEPSI